MYIELNIDNQKIDLEDFESLPLNFQLQISDFETGSVAGGNSKQNINLPPTKNNLQVFGLWYDTLINNQEAPKFKPFFISKNGIKLLEGQCQLMEFEGNNGIYKTRPNKIKVRLLSNNADWIKKIQGLEIRNLDWSDTNKDFNGANVIAGWNASVNGGEKVAFPLIKLKEWNTPGEVDKSEFTPALFVYDILTKIFAFAGYTIESEYLNSSDFKGLILPTPTGEKYSAEFSKKFLDVQANLVTPQAFSLATPQDNLITILYDDVLDNTEPLPLYDPLTGIYEVAYDGFYNITFSVSVSVTSPPPSAVTAVRISVFVNDVVVPGVVGAEGIINLQDSNSPYFIEASGVVEAVVGDEIKVKVNVLNNIAIDYEIDGGSLQIVGEATAGFGTPLVFEYLLEDWKASDIILGIQDVKNLKFEANTNTQVVKIEPRNDYLYTQRTPATQEVRNGFYTPTFEALDQKVDLRKTNRTIAKNNRQKIQRLSWNQEGATEDFINIGEPAPLYSASFNLGEDRFQEGTNERSVTFFNSTIHIFDSEITEDENPPVLLPLIYPQNYIDDPTAFKAPQSIKPRLLYFFGQRGGIDGQINVTSNGLIDTPACFFTNYADTTGLDPSLSFSDQPVGSNTVSIGALQRFYLWEFVQWKYGKEIERYINWKDIDIIDFTFSKQFLLEGGTFIVEKLNGYNPTKNQPTKTILSYVFPPGQIDVDNIEKPDSIGIVNLNTNNG